MIRNPARFGATVTLLASLVVGWLFGGCGENVTVAEKGDSGSVAFIAPDASTELPDASKLLQYCPSNQCPAGLTTCPNSRFPCDVDLRTDRRNCGACGFACPAASSTGELYECVEGRCELSCHVNSQRLDCDGLPDNGCETSAINNDHCGACGNKCTDPNKPCVQRTPFGNIGCGCFGTDLYCERYLPIACVDGQNSDQNCGECYNQCDPTNDGGVMYPYTYYGCVEGQCGKIKCVPEQGDCDQDITNGCEQNLLDNANCGACGNACPSGQECRRNKYGVPQCMCGKGQTFCPLYCWNGVCQGDCHDLATDSENCGTCKFSCRDNSIWYPSPYSEGVCSFGMCKRQCNAGRADCNGNMDDDCEIDTNSDPQNCGSCGIVCDAVAGQACVGGRCVVEPCSEDGGVTAR
jgi:hypothetical protein